MYVHVCVCVYMSVYVYVCATLCVYVHVCVCVPVWRKRRRPTLEPGRPTPARNANDCFYGVIKIVVPLAALLIEAEAVIYN